MGNNTCKSDNSSTVEELNFSNEEAVVASVNEFMFMKMNCVQDKADPRDWIFNVAEHSKVKGKELPARVDLRPDENFDVYNQGKLGSCTANALAAAFHFTQLQEGITDFCPSRLFIYFNERAVEGAVSEDSGASLRDGIKVLNRVGVCSEKLWPYQPDKFKTMPTAECYSAAEANICRQYARVEQNLPSLKGCLAAGHPFVFGFQVFCDFVIGETSSTGEMSARPRGMPHGGHAVQACGYDDEKEVFIVRNSWGEDWGDKGHFYMPYKFIEHPKLCMDFWAIISVGGQEFPTVKPEAYTKSQEEKGCKAEENEVEENEEKRENKAEENNAEVEETKAEEVHAGTTDSLQAPMGGA